MGNIFKLPSECDDLLSTYFGSTLVKVERNLYLDDAELDDYEQQSDGEICLHFKNLEPISFISNIEYENVLVNNVSLSESDELYEYRDITNNKFWKKFIGYKIKKITILKSKYSTDNKSGEFGVVFYFENGGKFVIAFDHNDLYFDTLHIINDYDGEYIELEINCI